MKKTYADFNGVTKTGKKKVDCWSNKNKLKPKDYSICSGKKAWFKCDNCPHSFEKNINNSHKSWCPYCCKPKQKYCKPEEDCKYCHEKSFASFNGKTKTGKKKVDCWSNKNKCKPCNVAIGKNKKFKFDCEICKHEFNPILNSVTQGTWCPYCAHQKFCKSEECEHCYNNSFANYSGVTENGKKKIDCWSNKNKGKPRDYPKTKSKKFIFHCDKCNNEFKATLGNVSFDKWCPICNMSVGELKVIECLVKRNLPNNMQKKFKNCKDIKVMPFDNFINKTTIKGKKDIAIEYDGELHFNITREGYGGGIDGYKKRKKHDIMKNKFCLEYGIILLRIPYTEREYIEKYIDYAIKKSKENFSGIIFCNSFLYKKAYLPIKTINNSINHQEAKESVEEELKNLSLEKNDDDIVENEIVARFLK